MQKGIAQIPKLLRNIRLVFLRIAEPAACRRIFFTAAF
jgi:hypothetical protein